MSGRWAPAAAFFGLHVDCGHYSTHRDKWLRLPVARFTCRWGCELVAVGVADVVDLTSTTVPDHARHCPGPQTRGTP